MFGERQVRSLVFAANTFAATLVALYVSFSLGLPRPYWAMSTVYIVSQPLSGALRSKGVYRLFGTVVGGLAAVALMPALSDAPELLSLALALWVALCLYLSLLDRTPRSYVFILAGYTAAIIGFPVAPAPGLVFDTAQARVEGIGLGVISATLVHTLVFPQGLGPVLVGRITGWLTDAQGWTLDVLAGRSDPARDRDRRQLAADATEIRILSTHLPFDTTNFRDTTQVVRALQDRMTLLLPLISAVGDRLDVLRAEAPLAPELQAALDQVARWGADTEATRADADRLHDAVSAVTPRLDRRADWRDVVQDNLVDRLTQLIALVQDIRDLRANMRSGGRRLPRTLGEVDRARRGSALHRDRYLAFLSAFAALVAILVCCLGWIGLGWTEGSLAAVNAAVFCSFFAAQDDPAPAIATFLWFTVASVPIVALYQFAILPAIDGFPMLAAVLAPTLLVVGWFVADPRFTSRALPVAAGVANGLALAETFNASFAGFANSEIAQVAGLVAAVLVTRLVRSVGVEWSARRILRAGWRELARLAAARAPGDRTRFTVLMLDRAGLLVSPPRASLAWRRLHGGQSARRAPGGAEPGRPAACFGKAWRPARAARYGRCWTGWRATTGDWRRPRSRPVRAAPWPRRRRRRRPCSPSLTPPWRPRSGAWRRRKCGKACGRWWGFAAACFRTRRLTRLRRRTRPVRQEVDVYGVFVPSLLVCAFVAYAITALVTRLLARTGFYRLVWHRALFDMAFFVILWGVVAAIGGGLGGSSAAPR